MNELFEQLGLDVYSLIFHAVNLAILIVALRLLLFNRVRNMVKKRRESVEIVFNENKRLSEEALTSKRNYEEMLDKTKMEAAKISSDVTEAAEAKRAQIIAEAQERAAEIVAGAHDQIDAERQRLSYEFKREVSSAAVDIASAILSREINKKDNDKVIADALEQWHN